MAGEEGCRRAKWQLLEVVGSGWPDGRGSGGKESDRVGEVGARRARWQLGVGVGLVEGWQEEGV